MYRGGAEVWQGFSKNATEGMATPIGLPIWTALLAGPCAALAALILGPPEALFPACVGIAVSLGTRIALAFRFGQNISNALLHPIGVLVMLAIQWSALWTAFPGTSGHMARAGLSVQRLHDVRATNLLNVDILTLPERRMPQASKSTAYINAIWDGGSGP